MQGVKTKQSQWKKILHHIESVYTLYFFLPVEYARLHNTTGLS